MKSKTSVLVSIKIVQMIGSVICLVLHIYGYSTNVKVQHITIFCGTYMGFTLVNTAFLVSAVMGKPAAEELDIAFGVIGSCLFYSCGVLALYFVREEQYLEKKRTQSVTLPNAYELIPMFFSINRGIAVVSLMTAFSFVFDACLKFDMWKYDLDVRRNKLPENAFDPPDLRLFCFKPCEICYRKWKQRRESMQGGSGGVSPSAASIPEIHIQDVTHQPMRGRTSSDVTPRYKWSLVSKASAELSQDLHERSSIDIRLSPPSSDSEGDIDVAIDTISSESRLAHGGQVQNAGSQQQPAFHETSNLGNDTPASHADSPVSQHIPQVDMSARRKVEEKTSPSISQVHNESFSELSHPKQPPSPPPLVISPMGDALLTTQLSRRGALDEASSQRINLPTSTINTTSHKGDSLTDITVNLNPTSSESESDSSESGESED